MLRRLLVAAIAVLAPGPVPPLHAQEPAAVNLELPFETFVLPNGLRVIVHEDRSLPLVAVNLWYHVGSKDERPGRTGFAHLFEHIMFEGSTHVPAGEFDRLLEAAGGSSNGSTSADRTNYWSVVPTGALELALWLEADRMGWLLPAMTQQKLDTQRDVVKNERRETHENRPYGLAWERLLAALYPPGHPYHWPTIGSMADLDAAGLDDVREFFRIYYAPNNATLALAGDIDAATARVLVAKYFEAIPRGIAVPRRAAPPAAAGDGREVLEDRVQLARLYMAWHTPASFQPDDAELDVAAHLLAGGKASRLYRRLVRERQVAQEVEAVQNGGLLGSAFVVVVTARPEVGLDELERAVRAELHEIAAGRIEPHEVERARNHYETALADDVQELAGRADRMNMYARYTGDAGFLTRDLDRYRRVTAAAVQEAVHRHLAGARGVVLSVVPAGRADLAAGEP